MRKVAACTRAYLHLLAPSCRHALAAFLKTFDPKAKYGTYSRNNIALHNTSGVNIPLSVALLSKTQRVAARIITWKNFPAQARAFNKSNVSAHI
ncbi:hypothetical protein DXN05_11160 [Deminuibacter soli]|uniref:Uncharacterized protein n=1 Tax=Deminuibacter soli TaxID=2291815 RepID=A0A3E1NJG7_9BACT|nr:hypothetical protein DXN05_11160 [Deminuibacter soli]